MKHSIMIAAMLMMAVFTVRAQDFATWEQNSQDADALVAEYVQPGTAAASYFEAMKDASFPSENDFVADYNQLYRMPNQTAAVLLNILLGDIGIGHFYVGQTFRGILDVLFCWTGIPGIIGLVEGIIWMCDDETQWAERVAEWNR